MNRRMKLSAFEIVCAESPAAAGRHGTGEKAMPGSREKSRPVGMRVEVTRHTNAATRHTLEPHRLDSAYTATSVWVIR